MHRLKAVWDILTSKQFFLIATDSEEGVKQMRAMVKVMEEKIENDKKEAALKEDLPKPLRKRKK